MRFFGVAGAMMTFNLHPPTKEVDVDFLVFVERYATDLLKWDILAFFAHHPDFCASASKIAQLIGRSTHSIRPELGDLVLLGILDQVSNSDHEIHYRLTAEPDLRRLTLKFARQFAEQPLI
jgi:hypothetical protein